MGGEWRAGVAVSFSPDGFIRPPFSGAPGGVTPPSAAAPPPAARSDILIRAGSGERGSAGTGKFGLGGLGFGPGAGDVRAIGDAADGPLPEASEEQWWEPSRSKMTSKRCNRGSAASCSSPGWAGTESGSSGRMSSSRVAAKPSVMALETTKNGRPEGVVDPVVGGAAQVWRETQPDSAGWRQSPAISSCLARWAP
jgi:hypothetical protein